MRVELDYWQALEEIAEERGMTLTQLLNVIDREPMDDQGPQGFTGRVRLYCLRYYRANRDRRDGAPPDEGAQAAAPRGVRAPVGPVRR